MKALYFLLTVLFSPVWLDAQDIIGVGTRWSDSFREWEFRTVDEYRTGRLDLRWRLRDDWTEWDYRMGDTTATMRLKWGDDPNLWEIRALGVTVTARTMWSNDFRQWRLDDGTHRIVWKTRYGNQVEDWEVRSDEHGYFAVYTYWEGDPRDWVVHDELSADVSYAMRLAMIFLTLVHSTPKI
ncbi:MAG: hypothetical protein R3301_02840 [Saprospiraceae bacterium]|nr:hypothetical protein [Saprospiraceae bacterium]